MYEPSWLMPCCGVVEEWQFHAVDVEDIHFQIWRPVNAAAGEWKLIGDIMIPGRLMFSLHKINVKYSPPCTCVFCLAGIILKILS